MYTRGSWVQLRAARLLLAAAALLLSSVAVHAALEAGGRDPGWSLALARAHCRDQHWIYVDTTPLYALARSVRQRSSNVVTGEHT